MDSNQITIVGRVASGFTYDHESHNESFYNFYVEVKRDSGTADLIQTIISERLIDVGENYIDRYVCIKGQFRSHNHHEEGKSRLLLYVFALEAEIIEESKPINDVFLEGYVCKPPVHRETPTGRQITDVILAINRAYNKCDYIPCICWGRLAYSASDIPVGACVRVAGRVQSREYKKDNGTKVAYELSVNLLERVS